MSHTKEPWLQGAEYLCLIYNGAGESIAGANTSADARRIVACVTACRGIPNGNLEAGGVLETIKAERDELLAAAKNLIKAKGRFHTEQAYKALEQAIANAAININKIDTNR